MKHKLFWMTILLSCSALLLTGCGAKDTKTKPPKEDVSGQDSPQDTDKDTPSDQDIISENKDLDNPDALEPDDFKDMLETFHSLMKNSYENDCAYNSQAATSPRIISATRQKNGDIRLAAVLCDKKTDTPLFCYVFTLVPNAYADGITEPMFLYSISSMTASSAINCEDGLSTLIASYQNFTDKNTVECKIDGNLMTFQVYDEDIITLLSTMRTGDNVTLAVKINEATESRTIFSLIMK